MNTKNQNDKPLTKAQQAKVAWLLQRMTSLENHDGKQPYRIFIESVTQCDYFVSVTLLFRRTDCEEYSPRMVVCSGGYNFHVYRGGRSKLMSSHGITKQDLKVVAELYHSTVDSLALPPTDHKANMARVRSFIRK